MNTKRRPRRPPGAQRTHDPQALRAIRRAKGIQQKELAQRLKLSASYMCEIESGMRSPSPELLKEMADALGVTVDAIKFRGCTCQCHTGAA